MEVVGDVGAGDVAVVDVAAGGILPFDEEVITGDVTGAGEVTSFGVEAACGGEGGEGGGGLVTVAVVDEGADDAVWGVTADIAATGTDLDC